MLVIVAGLEDHYFCGVAKLHNKALNAKKN